LVGWRDRGVGRSEPATRFGSVLRDILIRSDRRRGGQSAVAGEAAREPRARAVVLACPCSRSVAL
jgi:hypothetical protein